MLAFVPFSRPISFVNVYLLSLLRNLQLENAVLFYSLNLQRYFFNCFINVNLLLNVFTTFLFYITFYFICIYS